MSEGGDSQRPAYEGKICACGWKRPIIALVAQGGPPPPDVFPVYHCPNCGAFHSPEEISHAKAAAVQRDLLAELTKARNATS